MRDLGESNKHNSFTYNKIENRRRYETIHNTMNIVKDLEDFPNKNKMQIFMYKKYSEDNQKLCKFHTIRIILKLNTFV